MVVARRRWRQEQHSMEKGRLIFLDETGGNTSMTRRYGRSARGTRCLASVLHGHWHTNTFLAGLRHDGVQAPWLLDGPLNGEAFLAYIQHVLGSTLQPSDIIIADNLSSHKVEGVKEALAQWGASIIYLPPYSPDLNPIENFFSKLKALLRRAAERCFDGLVKAITSILDVTSLQECSNYFDASGYVYT